MENLLLSECFESQGLYFIRPVKALPLLLKGAVLIDLRLDFERAGKMPDVPYLLQIPYNELNLNLHKISKDCQVILADAVGIRSKEALKILTAQGYTNLVSLAGGIVDWERDGCPVTFDISERMSGGCMCQLKRREGKKSSDQKINRKVSCDEI